MTGKDERRQTSLGNLDAELFFKLSDQALLRGFTFFNLTAGELPEARKLFTMRPLSYEDATVDIHKCGGGDQNHRFFDSLGLHAGLIAP